MLAMHPLRIAIRKESSFIRSTDGISLSTHAMISNVKAIILWPFRTLLITTPITVITGIPPKPQAIMTTLKLHDGGRHFTSSESWGSDGPIAPPTRPRTKDNVAYSKDAESTADRPPGLRLTSQSKHPMVQYISVVYFTFRSTISVRFRGRGFWFMRRRNGRHGSWSRYGSALYTFVVGGSTRRDGGWRTVRSNPGSLP